MPTALVMTMINDRTLCKNCQYFYITYEPKHPYGCKRFGMKSQQMPSLVVKKTSGHSCLMYSPK